MMNNKETWEDVKEDMQAEPITLAYKMSYTVRNSLIGLEMILARYKFAAKMMKNRKRIRVLDLGCNDGLGCALINQQCDCQEIIGIDFDEEAIAWAQCNDLGDNMTFACKDFLIDKSIAGGDRDFVVSMDVIEHIPKESEEDYLQVICNNLAENGAAIIGTPNETMYPYASPWNKKAHINNYNQDRLYELCSRYFEQVFIFGMNDEVLHTGFYPMSCYIFALCCHKK